MKRLLLVIPLLILIGTNSAQIKDFSWGMKLGLNWATFTGNDASDFEVKTGLLFGAFVRHKLIGNLFVQPGFMYSNKGASRRLIDPDGLVLDFFHDRDHLEFPLLFKYFFSGKFDALKPNLFIGPVGSIKLNSVVELDADGVKADADEQDIKGSDFGLAFGGGLEFKVGETYLFLELRFARSFSSFDESVQEFDRKNSTFTIATGFTIN